MLDSILFFFLTLGISFIGTIPPGIVNLTTIRLSVERNIQASLVFSLGYTVMEMVYGYLAIWIVYSFSSYIQQIEFVIQLVSVPILLGFGLGLVLAKKAETDAAGAANVSSMENFKYGLRLGLFNPMALPYWVVFCTVNSAKLQEFNVSMLLAFEFGLGIGAFLLLAIYAFGGYSMKRFLNQYGLQLNKWIGWIFIGLAIVQLAHIFYNVLYGSSKQ
ncbi:MAG: LysE family translocator [Cytophagaceae bacterium]|nr:LysE family translocator [Cytophagaceae bacterium]